MYELDRHITGDYGERHIDDLNQEWREFDPDDAPPLIDPTDDDADTYQHNTDRNWRW